MRTGGIHGTSTLRWISNHSYFVLVNCDNSTLLIFLATCLASILRNQSNFCASRADEISCLRRINPHFTACIPQQWQGMKDGMAWWMCGVDESFIVTNGLKSFLFFSKLSTQLIHACPDYFVCYGMQMWKIFLRFLSHMEMHICYSNVHYQAKVKNVKNGKWELQL